MTSKNLWGDLRNFETIRTPKAILEEQARYLTDATGGLLVGNVDPRAQSPSAFAYDLDVQVPSLNNYVYTVLSISHDVDLYPVVIKCSKPIVRLDCEDQQQFEVSIGSILASPEVKHVLSALVAQAT
jgi:hypothetical protein